MHVLFVEDDEVVAQSVEAVLRKKGHSCQIAELGADAIALAKVNGYDIIVLDVGLPDMDGFHVIRRLKIEGVDTPVLLQSGLAGLDIAEGAVLGVNEFLAKPFSVSELIERMEAIASPGSEGEPAADPEPVAEAHPVPGPGSEAQSVPGPDAEAGPEPDIELGPEPETDIEICLEPEPDIEESPEPTDESPLTSGDEPLLTHLPVKQSDERRRHPRAQMFGGALIMDRDIPIPCVILNMSEGGAALRLSDPDLECPTLFTLRPLEGPERRCEVRWRKGDHIGVEFKQAPGT